MPTCVHTYTHTQRQEDVTGIKDATKRAPAVQSGYNFSKKVNEVVSDYNTKYKINT